MEAKIQNIHKLIDNLGNGFSDEVIGFQNMLYDIVTSNIDVVLSFKRSLFLKIKEMSYAFNDIKLELETTKKQLSAKDEELKSLKNCSKCSVLEKQLSMLKKKQAVNESRIKSIAKILARQTPGTQFTETVDTHKNEDSDQSSVTKAYNLVSQVLGCDDNYSGTETEVDEPVETGKKVGFVKVNHSPQKSRTLHSKKSPKADKDEELEDSDELLVCSFPETDQENEDELISPNRQQVEEVSFDSPVLVKSKKTSRGITPPVVRDIEPALEKCQELDYENMYWIPASPNTSNSRRKNQVLPLSPRQRKGKESDKICDNTRSNNIRPDNDNKTDVGKRKADFWQLKTTPFVDSDTSILKKQGSKLKQAKLSLGCFPKKVDVCFIKEFNGGIRPSQTSTQITSESSNEVLNNFKKPGALNCDDDIIMDSPQTSLSKNKKKGRSCSFGKKLACDVNLFPTDAKGDLPIPVQMPEDVQVSNKRDLQQEEKLDNSFDCLKKPSSSPKYKYRDRPVRKKIDRRKLPGWDCDNCRKYYEAAGGDNASEEEIKAIMNRCSKHRDKNPIRPRTPPGFWDADFPPTPDCQNLNITHTDVLPMFKKRKNK